MTLPTQVNSISSSPSAPLISFDQLAPQISALLSRHDISLSDKQRDYLHSPEVNDALRNEPGRQISLEYFQCVPEKYLEAKESEKWLGLALDNLEDARISEQEEEANAIVEHIENMRLSGLFFLPPNLLHKQAAYGTAENVEILLGFGTDINTLDTLDKNGNTPLQWAIDQIVALTPTLRENLTELVNKLDPDLTAGVMTQLEHLLPAQVRQPYQQAKTEIEKTLTDNSLSPIEAPQVQHFFSKVSPFLSNATQETFCFTDYDSLLKPDTRELISTFRQHLSPKLDLLKEWVNTVLETAQQKYPNLSKEEMQAPNQNQDEQEVRKLCENMEVDLEDIEERFQIIKVLLNTGANPNIQNLYGGSGPDSFFMFFDPEGQPFEDDQTIWAELYKLLTSPHPERAGAPASHSSINPHYRG